MWKFSNQRSYPFNNVSSSFGNATMKESRGRKIQRDSSRGWRMKRYFPFISCEGNEAIKSPRGGGVYSPSHPLVKRGENLRPHCSPLLAWPFSIPAQQSSRSENNSDFSFVNGPRTFDTRYTHPLMTGLAYLIDDAAEKSIQSALRCFLYTNLSCILCFCCLISRN